MEISKGAKITHTVGAGSDGARGGGGGLRAMGREQGSPFHPPPLSSIVVSLEQ